MKKTPLLAVALLSAAAFSATSAHAQGVRLGVKAGANYSNLAGDLTGKDNYEYKLGFHGGVMLNAPLTDDGFLSVQPELLFSQKGFQYADKESTDQNGNTYKTEGNINYNYLDVPVLLKINADGFYFEGGPQVGYLLSAKNNIEVKNKTTGQPVTDINRDLNIDNAKRFEVGYAAGLGYQSEAGWMAGIRYNGAFTKFGDEKYSNGELRDARNSVFQASVGYLFGGK
ncbi:PorT family protein [Hymenobacter sp. BT18]|uniref:porin family protein n=1 Tax=Hymenobacter sp. BT18 TaxID=2835648 RepID=UPI00143E86F9|nr:porin family protein [Hymenobacter sp. BT18]QIX62094.1 PorT family protein [Hymenobacter sp. BT18]